MRRVSALVSVVIAMVAGSVLPMEAGWADGEYNARINQGNVPATAAGYQQDCNSDEFGSKAATQDGWLFVASPSNFTAFEAVFEQGTVVLGGSNPNGTSVYFTKPNEHLAVLTPAGWTLTDAYANLDGNKTFFVLSHTCAASSQTQPPQHQSTPASAAISGTCDTATVTLNAGSSDTTFTITRAGDNGATASVPVAANSSDSRPITLDASHPSVSVSANGNVLDSFTRPDSCQPNDNNSQGNNTPGNNTPGGSGTGGGVTGTGGSDTGAGGANGSSGSPNTGGAVVSGTSTGKVTQPTATHVLGEKLSRSPAKQTHAAAVLGSSAGAAARSGALPFTGFVTANLLLGASAFAGCGALLLVLGRRRSNSRRS